jgi:hypothetical protein
VVDDGGGCCYGGGGARALLGREKSTSIMRHSLKGLQLDLFFFIRLRLARLRFTSEAIFLCFSSMNSSIGRVRAVLVNRLAKQLYM